MLTIGQNSLFDRISIDIYIFDLFFSSWTVSELVSIDYPLHYHWYPLFRFFFHSLSMSTPCIKGQCERRGCYLLVLLNQLIYLHNQFSNGWRIKQNLWAIQRLIKYRTAQCLKRLTIIKRISSKSSFMTYALLSRIGWPWIAKLQILIIANLGN